MEEKTFQIPSISCRHCTTTIENEIKEIDGVKAVSSSVEAKTVTVTWQAPASLGKIVGALKEINYPALET